MDREMGTYGMLARRAIQTDEPIMVQVINSLLQL